MATASRRAPLANISNATNSPHRFLTTSGSKRPRALANIPQQENEPPQKKQAVERATKTGETAISRQPVPSHSVEGRVFERGDGEAATTSFQKRLVAARDRNTSNKTTRHPDQQAKDDTIKQWQRHYRKIFPSFSFYFDGITEDARTRFMKFVALLGGKEERFFSKTVTHIVTARPIPVDYQSNHKTSDPTEAIPARSTADQPQTINPSLLDRNANTRPQHAVNVRRDATNTMDILVRGSQMGMKIWTVEKLQRVLNTIFDDGQAHVGHSQGSANTARRQQEDLSQVLRNEKLGATAERDQVTLAREVIHFKGPFIYVHDMDEKVRPTMVREYPKVARRQDGEWPQFRSASVGKCPFVEDPAMRKEMEQERTRQKALLAQQQKEAQQAQQAPRTRSTATQDVTMMEPPRWDSSRKPLQEVNNPKAGTATVDPAQVNKPNLTRTDSQPSFPPMPERQGFDFVRPNQLQIAREPAASGIQRSNLTSAIQSQMISSTAATGVKAATSKEVHELKRKVLERTHTGSLSVGSIPSSHRPNDIVGALKTARAPAPQRAAKSRAQEKLGGIQEEDDYADDVAAEKAAQVAAAKRKKQQVERTTKPGYCENCRDKYDDFEDHIVSRKHRKFAMTQSNWVELDALLARLQN